MTIKKHGHNQEVRYVLLLTVLVTLLSSLSFAIGVVSHEGTDVKVNYPVLGEITAQQASENLYNTIVAARAARVSTCTAAVNLIITIPQASPSGLDSGTTGHLGSQIKVNVGGVQTTVQQVISELSRAISVLESCS